MRKIISMFFILLLSTSANAKSILFSPLAADEIRSTDDITSSEEILSVEAEGVNVIIKTTKPSTYIVPLINSQHAQEAVTQIKESRENVFCKFSDEVKNCEMLQSRFAYRVERTKLFPSYYKALESKCETNKNGKMLYGKVGFFGGYKMNPFLAMAEGGPADSRGSLGLQIFDKGTLIKSIGLSESEITFLNNTNPLNSDAWINFDESRKMVILLDGQTCKVIGETRFR